MSTLLCQVHLTAIFVMWNCERVCEVRCAVFVPFGEAINRTNRATHRTHFEVSVHLLASVGVVQSNQVLATTVREVRLGFAHAAT